MTQIETTEIASDHALVLTAPNHVALRRAKTLSRELKNAARAMRIAKRSAFDPILHNKWTGQSIIALWTGSLKWIGYSFVGLALIPSLVCVVYFAFVASDQYTSEARFSVRAGAQSPLDTISDITGLAAMQQAQDSFIVADYINSRAIVDKLEARVGLRELYSHSDIDYISRFNKSKPIESLERYWRWKVSTSIENPSGIVTVDVRAFSPQDAFNIANAVVALSEAEVNELNARAERDLVAQAEREVKRWEKRMRQARDALRDFRNSTGVIDPRAQADSINTLIDQIKSDRIKMEQELSVVSKSLTNQAPQIKDLKSRIQAANDQIEKLRAKLTTRNPSKGGETISRMLIKYDRLELARKVVEKQYTSALAALEGARVSAERRRLYLNAFVKPTLPQEPSEPKRFWYSLASTVVFFTLWMIFVAIWQQLRSFVR